MTSHAHRSHRRVVHRPLSPLETQHTQQNKAFPTSPEWDLHLAAPVRIALELAVVAVSLLARPYSELLYFIDGFILGYLRGTQRAPALRTELTIVRFALRCSWIWPLLMTPTSSWTTVHIIKVLYESSCFLQGLTLVVHAWVLDVPVVAQWFAARYYREMWMSAIVTQLFLACMSGNVWNMIVHTVELNCIDTWLFTHLLRMPTASPRTAGACLVIYSAMKLISWLGK